MQITLLCRILRAFVYRNLLHSFEVKYIQGYKHSAFSADTSVLVVALVSPPRTHRHRCYGVLTLNSQLRTSVTALAQAQTQSELSVPSPCTAQTSGKCSTTSGWMSKRPRSSLACGSPLWEGSGTQMGEGAQVEPDWDIAARPAPGYEVDQRIN